MKPTLRTAWLMTGTLSIAGFTTITSTVSFAEPTLVVAVRHADRGDEPATDPALTPAGVRRASALASALASAHGPTLPKLCDTSFDHIDVLAYAKPTDGCQ